MSVTNMDRETVVMKPVRVYTCDGPGCASTHEQPATLKVMAAPPGWIYVAITPREQAEAPDAKHYCSHGCLVADQEGIAR